MSKALAIPSTRCFGEVEKRVLDIQETETRGMDERGMMSRERTMEEGSHSSSTQVENVSSIDDDSGPSVTVPLLQKIIAEVMGTYFLIFAGCASVIVNKITKGTITFPGICVVWGLAVTVLVYSVGHISGAHFNPAVTIAFATCQRFPWKQVPIYIAAQVLGSTLASGTLHLLFGGERELFAGTIPSGSNLQSLVLEFIISFYLMFVISAVATDNRAVGELAGIAVGATVLLIAGFAGPISGASMNPARTLGPAIIANRHQSIWVYMAGPVCGMIAGAWAYNLLRFTNKPVRAISKADSFLKSLTRKSSVG